MAQLYFCRRVNQPLFKRHILRNNDLMRNCYRNFMLYSMWLSATVTSLLRDMQ